MRTGRPSVSLPWLIEAIKNHQCDTCLIWPFSKNKLGYGTMRFRNKTHLAHRVAFYIANGGWPDPCGIHSCDTPACVSPRHVRAGTNLENVLDAKAKGRLKPIKGERVNTAKLTAEKVRQIRKEYIHGNGGDYGQIGLAKKYGVTFSTIGNIVRRTTWRHVT